MQDLKQQSGNGLFVGGVKLPLALAELGLIDEYELVVHPVIAGHGPTLLAGLSKHIILKPTSRREFSSGAVAMRYEAKKVAGRVAAAGSIIGAGWTSGECSAACGPRWSPAGPEWRLLA